VRKQGTGDDLDVRIAEEFVGLQRQAVARVVHADIVANVKSLRDSRGLHRHPLVLRFRHKRLSSHVLLLFCRSLLSVQPSAERLMITLMVVSFMGYLLTLVKSL